MPTRIVQQYPVPSSNDVQLQFADINISLGGRSFPWCTAISYSDGAEPGEARGVSPFPMGTTLGEYKAEGKLTIHRKYRDTFIDVISQGRPGIYNHRFPIIIQTQAASPDGSPDGSIPIETDTMPYCRVTGFGQDYSTGNNVLVCDVSLYIAIIYHNGRAPLPGIPNRR